MTQKPKLIRSNFIHSPTRGEIEYCLDYLCAIDQDGYIAEFTPFTEQELLRISTLYSISITSLITTEANSFFVPGFIDTHIHAPQIRYVGTGTDRPLLQWLEEYAFKTERLFSDNVIAERSYSTLVDLLLSHGTTSAVYFATIHLEATKTLARICLERGQRSFIGKVSMDRNGGEDYVESLEESVQNTKAFIEFVHSLQSPLIHPVITPRFIPTCTSELLSSLSNLLKLYPNPPIRSAPSIDSRNYCPLVYVQSHLSESHDEIDWVSKNHTEPQLSTKYGVPTDTDIFKLHGLLTDRSIYAHAIHLSDSDVRNICNHRASLSHCPLSNFYFGNGIMTVQRLLQNEVQVSLGTDIAGGPGIGILSSMRSAVVSSKCINLINKDEKVEALSYVDAFYLATMGGAKAISMSHLVGMFGIHRSFDACLINPLASPNSLPLFDGDSDGSAKNIKSMFEKFINLGDDRNIIEVYIQGKELKKRIGM